jgi:hypothetical protein
MGVERKRKQVTYKLAKFHAPAGDNLRNLVAAALKKRRTVGNRRQGLAPEGESPIWRLISEYKNDGEFLFGAMVQYAPGTNPVFCVDDDGAEILTVEQFAAPITDEGKRREALDGILFFGMLRNHIVMLQGSSLRNGHFERHLQWLLQTARVIEGTNTVALTDLPPLSTRRKLRDEPVKEVELGGELITSEALERMTADEEEEEVTTRRRTEVKSVEFQDAIGSDKLAGFLQGLMRESDAARLPLADLAGSNIEYSLKLTYKRTTTERGQRLMNKLGAALRNARGVDTKLHLKNGDVVTGQELKLGGLVVIDTYNGMPSPSEVYEALRQWLLQKVNTGDVAD